MHTSHDYIWYDQDKWAPRFCYIDSENCPVDLLGAVWRFHPGLVAYVEEDGKGVWVASVSVRINGTHTETVRVPVYILQDALSHKVIHTEEDGHTVEKLVGCHSGKAL